MGSGCVPIVINITNNVLNMINVCVVPSCPTRSMLGTVTMNVVSNLTDAKMGRVCGRTGGNSSAGT